MATNTAGSAARQYHTQQIHYLRKTVGFGDDATELTVGVVPSGALILKAISGAHVTTAFDGSGTDLIDIGTSDDGDLFATDLDVSTVGFKVCDEDVGGYLVTSDTTITCQYDDSGDDASAGSAEVIIAYIPDNDG